MSNDIFSNMTSRSEPPTSPFSAREMMETVARLKAEKEAEDAAWERVIDALGLPPERAAALKTMTVVTSRLYPMEWRVLENASEYAIIFPPENGEVKILFMDKAPSTTGHVRVAPGQGSLRRGTLLRPDGTVYRPS